MKINYTFLVGWLWLLPLAAAQAENIEPWLKQLEQRVAQHPAMQAALQAREAGQWQARALEQPLYNPELETAFDREGPNNNYSIGINQTIDLWNKRGLRKEQAKLLQSASRWYWQQALQARTVEVLQALLDWQLAQKAWQLARQQESQTSELLKLVDQRQQAGDLGEIDAELAYLDLSQRLQQTAAAEVAVLEAEKQVQSLLPGWKAEEGGVPADFWNWLASRMDQPLKTLLEKHPQLAALRAERDLQQQAAELAEKERRPDPTLGIAAGQVDGDSSLGLNLSIPLNVRNTFVAEVREAETRAQEADAQWQAAWREREYRLQALQQMLQVLAGKQQHWQQLMAGRLERSARLLEKQWRNGDLSTAEYLLALDKRIEAQLAGLELERHYRSTQLQWLLESARLPVEQRISE